MRAVQKRVEGHLVQSLHKFSKLSWRKAAPAALVPAGARKGRAPAPSGARGRPRRARVGPRRSSPARGRGCRGRSRRSRGRSRGAACASAGGLSILRSDSPPPPCRSRAIRAAGMRAAGLRGAGAPSGGAARTARASPELPSYNRRRRRSEVQFKKRDRGSVPALRAPGAQGRSLRRERRGGPESAGRASPGRAGL